MHRVSQLLSPTLLLFMAPLLASGACDNQPAGTAMPISSGGKAEPGQVVARVGATEITVDDLQEHINRENAFVRSRYNTPEKLKEYLDNLVRFEVMAQEAERRGYSNDPDIVRIFKQQMVARLMQKDFEAQLDPAKVPDELVRRYWEENKQRFHVPEKVRASHIVVTDPKIAADVAEAARKLAKGDDDGWNKLVQTYSIDMGSRPVGGDLGAFAADANVREKEVVAAVFALTEVGSIAGPVQSPRGYHIIKLTGRIPGRERAFEEAEKEVRVQVYKQQRAQALKDWVAGLRGKAKIEVMPDNVNKVKVDMSDAAPKNTAPPFFQTAEDFLPGLQGGDAKPALVKPAETAEGGK